MSLARAMTRRMRRAELQLSPPTRASSMRDSNQHIDRNKISSPVALLSTTNMLSYNAPDIATMRHASSSSSSTLSHSSAEDSDHTLSSNRSRETLTDASSIDSSPTSPEPNHLSCYFPATQTPHRSASSGNLFRKSELTEKVPGVPERAVSHSKRAHERVVHKRSLQNMKPPSSLHMREQRSSREHRTYFDMFKSTVEEGHPFGKELEQLNEVVEEFGGVVMDVEMEEDLASMSQKGLVKLCATDYLDEIRPLYSGLFESQYLSTPTAWI